MIMISMSGCSRVFSSPPAGEWSGENGSFTLLESGEISNFYWSFNADDVVPSSRCPIQLLSENIPVVDGKGDITFTYKETGAVSFSIEIVFNTATTATLSYMYDMCPSTFTIGFDENGKTVTYTGEEVFTLVNP